MAIKTVVLSIALSVIIFLSAGAQTTSAPGDSLKTVVGKWAGTFEGGVFGEI